jgi:hypothetical protein
LPGGASFYHANLHTSHSSVQEDSAEQYNKDPELVSARRVLPSQTEEAIKHGFYELRQKFQS